jgi:pilin isopeptide linkage protein/uncharacterized repeat protein (TIGR01451 family)
MSDHQKPKVSQGSDVIQFHLDFGEIEFTKAGTYRYVITETTALADNWSSNNQTATATVKVTDNGKGQLEAEVTTGTITNTYTQTTGASIVISKATTNGAVFTVGDTIGYSITVRNNGRLPLTNVVVNDPLTGASWNVGNLAVGASRTFTTAYAAGAAGAVTNTATVTAASEDPQNPTLTRSASVTSQVNDPVPPTQTSSMTVTKTITSTPEDGEMYRTGETIEYEITITNDGEADQINVTVTDPLTGDVWQVGELASGESRTFTATYVVTEEDAERGTVSNTATATGDPADGTNPPPTITPGTVDTEVGPPPTPEPEPSQGRTIPPLPRGDGLFTPTPAPETIEPEPVPLAGGAWALINLLCMILSVLLAVVLLITYFTGKKKDEEEDEDEATRAASATDEDEEEKAKLKRKGIFRLLSIIPGVGAVIAFILTEDIRLPMIYWDRWTWLMIVIAAISVILAILSKKSRKDAEENEENQEA